MATINSAEMVDQNEITATDLRQIADEAVRAESENGLVACYRVGWLNDTGQAMEPDLQAVVIQPAGAQRLRIGIALNADAQWGDLEPHVGGNDSFGFGAAVHQAVWDYLNDADAWEARN